MSVEHSSTVPLRRLVAASTGFPLVAFLGATLLVRVLTDSSSAPDSRHSGSLNLSGVIALLFVLVAAALMLRRRRGVLRTALAALWLCAWTIVAIATNGASSETLREGVREGSVLALAVIIYNARNAVTVPIATRLVQLVGVVPALVALYQLATHTGMDVAGHLRANGTFAHPNSAVMFFALAATASVWRYLDYGRHRVDGVLVVVFAAAVISTFSIDGLITMFAMMMAFGWLHPGTMRVKLVPITVGALTVVVFLATPLGTQRIANESSTNVAAAERGESGTSLTWRINKWKTLMAQWERSPIVGRGLGTTTTAENTVSDPFAGFPPHNEYVRYLVETGIIGLAMLLYGLVVLVRGLVHKRRIQGRVQAGTSNIATLALVIVIGCLVNSLADNTLLDSPTCYGAGLLVTAALASPIFQNRSTSSRA